MLRGGPFPAGPAPLLPQVTLAALVLHVRYSASPPQSSGLRTSRRLWPAAPYAAARLWGQGPGPRACLLLRLRPRWRGRARAETQGRDQTWGFLAPQEGSREDSRARAARVAADGRRATCADSPRAPEPQRPRARRGSAVGGLGSPLLRPGAPCSAELPAGSRALPPPLISLFKAARGGRGAPSARFTVENRDT